MFLLTNDQRKCFSLSEVQDDWSLCELTPSKYDLYSTYAYISPDNRVVKIIIEGDTEYREYDVSEVLSSDRTLILPKTAKGKPVKLTAANMEKKTPVGMALSFARNYISLFSCTNDCTFYNSFYAGITLNGMSDFYKWINKWCEETSEKEISDINAFASAPKRHIKFKEGDFFRFRLDRHNFGYGRIIIDFAKMRKEKIPFWDAFMGKPILAGIYHIVTQGEQVSVETLNELKMLPPQMIMDNVFFYGECEIIGNLPVDESQIDFPIHYGPSLVSGDNSVMYQCGRVFIQRQDIKSLFPGIGGFRNTGIGWKFDVTLPILLKCIQKQSNLPYWEQENLYRVREDLRNPKYKAELKQILEQLGLI